MVAAIGVGAYLYLNNSSQPTERQWWPILFIYAPGKNGAVLTLADGSQLVLDSMGNGMVATQNGTQVLLKGGELAYAPAGSAVKRNRLQYHDHSQGKAVSIDASRWNKGWLNAASSLPLSNCIQRK